MVQIELPRFLDSVSNGSKERKENILRCVHCQFGSAEITTESIKGEGSYCIIAHLCVFLSSFPDRVQLVFISSDSLILAPCISINTSSPSPCPAISSQLTIQVRAVLAKDTCGCRYLVQTSQQSSKHARSLAHHYNPESRPSV